ENVEDHFKLGDIMPVKLIKIDEMGRLDLSRREALIERGEVPAGWAPQTEGDRDSRPPRREHSGSGRGPSRGPRPGGPGGFDRGPRRDHGGPDRGPRHDGPHGDQPPRPPRPEGEGSGE
ncbi:MAG: polyribonucleotide nucleotidyltransferase, partial [Candidatus Wallbacteria bacterium]|nr:polyribonucleotide nucleotidyltransferase [Candidatus Wallbacteria bacterium]